MASDPKIAETIAKNGLRVVKWQPILETTNLTLGIPQLEEYFLSLSSKARTEAKDNFQKVLAMMLFKIDYMVTETKWVNEYNAVLVRFILEPPYGSVFSSQKVSFLEKVSWLLYNYF